MWSITDLRPPHLSCSPQLGFEKNVQNSKFVGRSSKIIRHSKIFGPLTAPQWYSHNSPTHSQNQFKPKLQNASPDFGYMVQKCKTKL